MDLQWQEFHVSCMQSFLLKFQFIKFQEKSSLETQVLELTSERDKLSERLTSLGVIGDPADKMQKELDAAK